MPTARFFPSRQCVSIEMIYSSQQKKSQSVGVRLNKKKRYKRICKRFWLHCVLIETTNDTRKITIHVNIKYWTGEMFYRLCILLVFVGCCFAVLLQGIYVEIYVGIYVNVTQGMLQFYFPAQKMSLGFLFFFSLARSSRTTTQSHDDQRTNQLAAISR